MNKELLFQPVEIPCGATIKNRFFKSAMSEGLGTKNHAPTKTLIALYEAWASGGAGVLITGNIMIDSSALGEPRNVVIENEDNINLLKKWASAGTKDGTHLWVQLNHPGKQSPKMLTKEPVAPSAIPLGGVVKDMFAVPRALTIDEIHNIVKRFAVAAKIAKKAGFTGVQIHGAHGYLVSQFLSSLHNQRSDEYGGSLENRMRFVVEVYKAIRQEVGPQFPVGIKLNSADFQKGGFTEEESLEVVKMLDSLGIDCIEISGGTYEQPAMTGAVQKESTKRREAYFLKFAEEVKRVVRCPVIVTGGFRSTEAMVEAIESGSTDMIGMARPLALVPDLPNQIKRDIYTGFQSPVVKTGIKAIDKNAGLIETVWYEFQLKGIGNGNRKEMRGKNIGLGTVIKVMMNVGFQAFQKRRA